MTQCAVRGHGLSDLLDVSTKKTSFGKVPRKRTPIKNNGSVIYSIWDDVGTFLYVGISGVQKDELSRIKTHARGRRSDDQFCVYVQDYFIVPWLGTNYKRTKGKLDKLTKCYIRTCLSYRLKIIKNDSGCKKARYLEKTIKQGAYGKKPLLNGEGEW